MWFKKHEITYKKERLEIEIPIDYYSKPCTEEEFNAYIKCTSNFSKTYKDTNIPKFLKLPKEYIQLLKFSNGGSIVNEEREFGFFDMETIRYFYVSYGFIIEAPNLLPIAFNGGGTFYVYKFLNEKEEPKIYGVHASCIGFDECTCFLGNTLEEVLNKEHDIDDDIYEYQVANGTIKIPVITKEEQERINLLNKLKELKEKKSLGKIGLKEYLKTKREIESKLNGLV